MAAATNEAHKPNFTGYWRLVKHDNLDAFLKELEIPWVMRKLMIKYVSNSVDIINHNGSSMRVTTVNAKTSWTRTLTEGREITQKDAEGTVVKTTVRWEGDFHKTRLEGGKHGAVESWRHVADGLMIVRTTLAQKPGREVAVTWYLEELSVPGLGDAKQISRDQRRVEKATSEDNVYAQKLVQTRDKWVTPADRYLSHADADVHRKESIPHLASRSDSPPSSVVSPGINMSPPASTGVPAEHPVSSSHTRVLSTSSSGRRFPMGSTGALSDGDRSETGRPAEDNSAGLPSHPPLPGTAHRRVASYGQMSDYGADKKQLPDTVEAQLSLKLQEYSENRSITSVLPVENPLASDEPELLEMSPEEAEGTQLKMAEMEREAARVSLKRQKFAAGHSVGCCTLVFHSVLIPPYIRAWDM